MMLNSTLGDHSKEYAEGLQLSVPILASTKSNQNSSLASDPATWTENEVEEWLKDNDFEDSVDLLCHQNHADGQYLMNLSDDEVLLLTNNSKLCSQIKALKSKSKRSTVIQLEPLSSTCERYKLLTHVEDHTITTCCLVKSIRSDHKKTLVSFCLLVLTIVFNSFMITFVDERLPDPKVFPPLPDLILDNIPEIPRAISITEWIILVEMIGFIILVIFHRYRIIILRRLFIIMTALYFLRCFTMILTALPLSTKLTVCKPKIFHFRTRLHKAFMIFIGQGLSSFGVQTCGDYLYSGHTCTLILLKHFINEYSPRKCIHLHIGTWILALSGMFCILAAHQHYSIDILIAWVLSSRLFIYYHTLANNRGYLQRDRNRMKFQYPFFCYMEENVKAPVQNEYCLPSCFYRIPTILPNFTESARVIIYCIVIFVLLAIMYSFTNLKYSGFSTLIER